RLRIVENCFLVPLSFILGFRFWRQLMANVLLLTWGTGGDVVPMVRIGQGLKARGHEVTLITSYSHEARARQAGLRFAGLNSAEENERFLQDVNRLARPIEFIRHFRQRLVPRIPHEYAVIRQ